MIYDYYRLYFAREHYYAKRYIVDTLDMVYTMINNLSDTYDEYLIIGHNNELDQDEVIEHQRIEHKTRKKGR